MSINIKWCIIDTGTNVSEIQALEVVDLLKHLGYGYFNPKVWLKTARQRYPNIKYLHREGLWAGSRESANITAEDFIKVFGKPKYSIKGLYEN